MANLSLLMRHFECHVIDSKIYILIAFNKNAVLLRQTSEDLRDACILLHSIELCLFLNTSACLM